MLCLWSGPPVVNCCICLLRFPVMCNVKSLSLFYLILYHDLYVPGDYALASY